MRDFIKSKFKFITKIVRNFKIKKRSHDEYRMFKDNWIYSKCSMNKIGYEIILDEHSIEKGMTSSNPRCFGVNKVKNIIRCLNLYEKNCWSKDDFAYNLGVSILFEYCKFYEIHNWIDKSEYFLVKEFIKNKKTNLKTGVIQVAKSDFITNANIDYLDFLNSRHSFRNFQKRKISNVDMRKAVNMALKTPTACNRQMCKIYYIKSDEIRNKIIKFSHGLTNFDNDSVNVIIITYDICSLCVPGELTQGMFNAGLVSMNFVNALHSIGIGSCFLEYSNDLREENKMKNIIGIPLNEKIAVVIAAGYYPEKSVVPLSTRKNIDEIYHEI